MDEDEQLLHDQANSVAGSSDTSIPDDEKILLDHINSASAAQQAPGHEEAPAGTLEKIGAGLEHGTLSVPKAIGYGTADYLAKQAGADPARIAEVQAARKAEEDKYQKRYGDSTIAAASSIPGQVVAASPYLAMGGELLDAGTGLAGKAIPASVSGALQTNGLTRFGTKVGLGLGTGALQGGAFNLLTGENPKQGAETGAVINGVGGPVLGAAYRYGADKISPLVQPFFESGRNNIANKIVQGYAESPLNINATEIVPGSKPTLAEATGNPGIAQLQDTLRDNNSNQFTQRQMDNVAARNNHLESVAGTKQDIQSAAAQRQADAEQQLGNPQKGIPSQLFSVQKPTDPAEVLDTIDKITNGKSGNRPAVVQSMEAVKKMLNDADGNPITDPETLYHSVRKGIRDLMDKKNLTNPAGQQASAELKQVRDALDNVIEKGAPGFKKYLNDYSQASSPINAMKWMQGLNLKDSQGNITLSGVQNALKNANKLQGTPGISAAKDLSPTQITTLENIRDDLLRQQNLSLGKSYGSPTTQKALAQNKLENVLTNSNYHLFSSKIPLEAVGATGGGVLAHHLGMPVDLGAAVGGIAGGTAKKALSSKNDLIREKLQNIMLNPQSYMPPGPANAVGSNLLQSPLLHYGIVPTGNSIFNSLQK